MLARRHPRANAGCSTAAGPCRPLGITHAPRLGVPVPLAGLSLGPLSHPAATMVAMNTVAVSAAVSAVVTVIVGTIVNWGERIVSWGLRRATPDHVPIGNGSGW